MERPHIRNPRGFRDVFPVLLSYVIVTALLIELASNGLVRPVVAAGTLLVVGWLVWAVARMLEPEATEPDDDLE